MRVLVNFSADIGLSPIEKDVSPNQTIENLQILISLSYEKMNQCKLTYQGRTLNNKAEILRNAVGSHDSIEVTVSTKNELQAYADKVSSLIQLFQQYPTYFVGGIVGLIFLILFVMGGAS